MPPENRGQFDVISVTCRQHIKTSNQCSVLIALVGIFLRPKCSPYIREVKKLPTSLTHLWLLPGYLDTSCWARTTDTWSRGLGLGWGGRPDPAPLRCLWLQSQSHNVLANKKFMSLGWISVMFLIKSLMTNSSQSLKGTVYEHSYIVLNSSSSDSIATTLGVNQEWMPDLM